MDPAAPALLHARLPALRETLPRVALTSTPTPVRPLPGLAADAGGIELWCKDDARSDPLWGGNKPRKLEWVLADALRRRRRTVLTFGGLATNHGLATALHCRELGLRCALALVDQPEDEHVRAQLARIRASGAAVHLTRSPARTVAALPWLLARHGQLRPRPAPPYLLPAGGSSPLGTVGFAEAALELAAQVEAGELPAPRTIVVPLGSGGTAAGLLLGLALAKLPARVLAIKVNDKLPLSEQQLRRLAGRTAALLRRRGAREVPDPGGELVVRDEWLGAGYGHRTPEADAALRLARERESLELEPVYTAKALAAVLALGRRGELSGGPVLLWQTHGGGPEP